jgi:hypothetical protein
VDLAPGARQGAGDLSVSGGHSGPSAAIWLPVSLIEKIGDETFQETANETDEQHHLPSQSACLEFGVADL